MHTSFAVDQVFPCRGSQFLGHDPEIPYLASDCLCGLEEEHLDCRETTTANKKDLYKNNSLMP